MGAVATIGLDGGCCFGLVLEALRSDPELSVETAAADAVAFVTALEGQTDARFVVQTLVHPDADHVERGKIQIAILTIVQDADDERIDELCDDLLDILDTPPHRWIFRAVNDGDELGRLAFPFEARSFAEIARREEPCEQMGLFKPAGFNVDPSAEPGTTQDLWCTWTMGPVSGDLDRAASVLLAQEDPVCVRVVLEPASLAESERAALQELMARFHPVLADKGLERSALSTLSSFLSLRPIFATRYLVASPRRLSRSLLSALGGNVSAPADHASPSPILQGGFAVIRGGVDSDADVLADAFRSCAIGSPTPTLGDPSLARLRRLMGTREAANLFRIPMAGEHRYPGVETSDIPALVPPIAELPVTGTRVGTLAEDSALPILLERESRFRHTYVVGQTGTGKSTLLKQMALQDIEAGDGVAVIDPHGDLVADLLARIPAERRDDVVLLDPADPEAVIGVNLLEADSPVQAQYLIDELAHMFETLFDPHQTGIVGPRFTSMLRQAARLLMATPDTPASMLDIATVFADHAVRTYLVEQTTDPMTREFWTGQDRAARSMDHGEIVAWFTAKFDTFRASDLVRNVVGQTSSTISFTEVLNEKRILLVNLSKGLLGTYNSGLIGYVVFAKLWGATLERAAQSRGRREPFHIYIDEFQNITSESLPTVLAEARKFNVSMTLANQFFSQIRDDVRQAIMGNIGSKIAFRLGPSDSGLFGKWIGDEVDPGDLLTLPNYTTLVSLSRSGVPLDPFVSRTDAPTESSGDGHAETIRQRSREQWARPVAGLDEEFANRWAHVPGSVAQTVAMRKRKAQAQPATGEDGSDNGSFLDRWLAKYHDPTPDDAAEDDDD